MTTTFQFSVKFIQQDIARNRTLRAALRKLLFRVLEFVTNHYVGVQLLINQRDYTTVFDDTGKYLYLFTGIHRIKETLKITDQYNFC